MCDYLFYECFDSDEKHFKKINGIIVVYSIKGFYREEVTIQYKP